jgi:hypothetical protein
MHQRVLVGGSRLKLPALQSGPATLHQRAPRHQANHRVVKYCFEVAMIAGVL